jgi:tetratricopeptide (TPR) repeat protein
VLEQLRARLRESGGGRADRLDLARAGRFPKRNKGRAILTKRQENRAAQRLLATVLFERGTSAEGERILRNLMEADADDPSARRLLASEYVRERRFNEAKVMYQDMIKAAGDEPRKREIKASAVSSSASSPTSSATTPGERSSAPSRSTALGPGRAARILLAADRDSETSPTASPRQAFPRRSPRTPSGGRDGRVPIPLGDKKTAQAALDALGASGQLEKMMAAADAYGRLKLYDPAVRIAREAVARNPESTDALFRLASSLERGGNPAEGEKVFLQLLAMRPNDSATQNYLGYMWADQGVQLEKARDMLEKAVAREPRNAAYLDSLGWAYFRLGELQNADKNLREAYRREPADPTIEEHIGDLEARQGNMEGAIRHWEKALALKHDEPDRVREKLQKARAPVSQR